MAGLTIDEVTKAFGPFEALKRVSLTIADGEFVAVLGPSGCGKTTLLRTIAGFERLSSGSIRIDDLLLSGPDHHLPPEARKIGIVFQNYALWPHMSVAENVGYALRVAKIPRAERDRRVTEALALVDLGGMGGRRPANLSGGQRQRVALARCLVAAPSLVLFDEPLANLDVHLRAAMEAEFADFHRRAGTTILYITHDQAEAMALADRIAVMDHGRLMQFATPQELYACPVNAMVARFIAGGIVLPARVTGAKNGGEVPVTVLGQEVVMRCRPGMRAREEVEVCLRPADLQLVEAGGIEIRVERIVYRGGGSRIEARAVADPALRLGFDLPEPQQLAPDATAHLALLGGWVLPEEVPA